MYQSFCVDWGLWLTIPNQLYELETRRSICHTLDQGTISYAPEWGQVLDTLFRDSRNQGDRPRNDPTDHECVQFAMEHYRDARLGNGR